MQPEDQFQWHASARFFVGKEELTRTATVPETEFLHIPSDPTAIASAALGHALISSTPFCISRYAQTETARRGDFLTLTGGTSGPPKALRRSQASWISSFAINAQLFKYSTDDRSAVLGSLEHSLALYGTLEALHLGLDAYVLSDLRAEIQARVIAEKAISVLYATPTQLRLLCKTARQMPALRLILCGGGMLDGATREVATTLCPNAALRVFYGAAESSFITISDADTPPGSVGRAYPKVDLLLDRDGLIWIKSPYVFAGYANPAKHQSLWKNGYLTVGEVGEQDAEGHLFLKGRKGRMVTIADRNVYPEEVEAVITALPGAPLCAVIARPDPLRGAALLAVIEGPDDPALRTRILTACRAALDPLAVPRRAVFLETIPLLPSGKTDLAMLSQLLDLEP